MRKDELNPLNVNVHWPNSNFEWGCCCENIQIAPLVHYASTHSLNTWTQPPPALTLGAMVPVSASCGWRMVWVVTLPVVSRPSWWPLCHHILLCVYVRVYCGTLCLFDIAALCSPPDPGKDNGYCICSHKEKLFLQAPEASVSPPSLTRLVTPVTAGERGQDHS